MSLSPPPHTHTFSTLNSFHLLKVCNWQLIFFVWVTRLGSWTRPVYFNNPTAAREKVAAAPPAPSLHEFGIHLLLEPWQPRCFLVLQGNRDSLPIQSDGGSCNQHCGSPPQCPQQQALISLIISQKRLCTSVSEGKCVRWERNGQGQSLPAPLLQQDL